MAANDAVGSVLVDYEDIVRCCVGGHSRKLMALLRSHALDLNTPVSDLNQTLLHFAAKVGQISTVQTLCNAGAFLDPVDANGRTPLHLAIAGCHEEVVLFLLESGANPLLDVKSKEPTTTLEKLLFSKRLTTLDLAQEGALIHQDDPKLHNTAIRIHERLDKATCSNTESVPDCMPCEFDGCVVS